MNIIMSENKLDFYFSQDQADQLIKFNKEAKRETAMMDKVFFKGALFTESVKTNTKPKCSVAKSEFLGTGSISDTGIKGKW